MDEQLRESCLNLFEACLAQIRSGSPGPSLLTEREFEQTLVELCRRLKTQIPSELTSPSGQAGEHLQYIVSQGRDAAREGLTNLRRWLSGATEVIICDPYLFQFRTTAMFSNVEVYARTLVDLLPRSVTKLDLYTNGYAKGVKPIVFRALKEGRTVRHFSSYDLHDRFIIRDRSAGKIIGTSFGGFGSKFFALLDLPSDDVAEVRTQLQALCPLPLHRNRRT